MNEDISCMRDPVRGGALKREADRLVGDDASYPIVSGIPRFVASGNYADDFGLQWNAFAKTQLDSHIGTDISESRLRRCLRGHLPRLAGKLVLEAGSGAGRFTEILLKNGANLHSFDFSSAVDANARNNGDSDRLVLAQADIRSIPFSKGAYDYVICLGVIQHTPNPDETIRSLWSMVRPGGYLVIDHYEFKWRNVLPPPIGVATWVYRKLVLMLPKGWRLRVVSRIVDFWFPLHWAFRKSAIAQQLLRRVSPVHFYYPSLPLGAKERFYEWALLDTHDGLTDHYKHHRSVAQIRKIFEALGAVDVVVDRGGNGVEAFCRKPEGVC